MQLPSVDRQPHARPAGPDGVAFNVGKVVPVAPVNPSAAASSPSVVNKISEAAVRVNAAAAFKTVPDPAKRSEEATSPRDWTIHRPEPEKVEIPPPEPISKLLLEFVQSMWRASGGAVEIAQAQNQNLQLNQNNPKAAPGELAKEDLTYSPNKIKKNEKL